MNVHFQGGQQDVTTIPARSSTTQNWTEFAGYDTDSSTDDSSSEETLNIQIYEAVTGEAHTRVSEFRRGDDVDSNPSSVSSVEQQPRTASGGHERGVMISHHGSECKMECINKDGDAHDNLENNRIRAELDPTFASFNLSANMILSDSDRQALLESPNEVSRLR